MAGLDDRRLDEALRAAVDHQLLIVQSDEDAYTFRHALLLEAVYSELLPGERRRLHTTLARVLTDLLRSGDLDWPASTAEVAVHWYWARDLSNALEWSVRAGVEADGIYAYAEALRHYGRALDLWDRLSDAEARAGMDRLEVLQRAARAANASGDVDRALALIDQALQEVDPVLEPVRAGLLHEHRGVYLMVTRDLQSRFEALREAVRLIPTDPPSEERARVLASFAEALVMAPRIQQARAASEEAVAIARQLGAELEIGRALMALGWAQAASGAFEAGVASLREACRLAEQHADLDTLGRAYGWLGEVLMQAGRLEDAAELWLSGRGPLRRLGLAGQWQDTFLLANAAKALFELGRWDEADRLAAKALEQARLEDGYAFCMVAMLEVGRGEFQAAEAHLGTIKERSLSLAGIPGHAREYAALEAELRIWQGRLNEARAAVQDGLDRVAETDEWVRSGLLLCLGMRVEADWAELGRARRDRGEVEVAICAANALVSQAATMAPNPLVPGASPVLTTPAMAALFEAEHSRMEGRSDPVQWQKAATAWLTLRRPYPAVYAQWRQAEALLAARGPRAPAEETLRAAHAVAVRLRAVPLRRELELLAQRGRVRLQAPTQPTPAKAEAPSTAASLGLTPREAEVLALVAAGRTNRQIGQELFITEKTASVTSRGSWSSLASPARRGSRDRPSPRARPAMIERGPRSAASRNAPRPTVSFLVDRAPASLDRGELTSSLYGTEGPSAELA